MSHPRLDPRRRGWLYSGHCCCVSTAPDHTREGISRMADWDVIAKQRLTEDWGTLRAAYLPLNQGMRRTIEFLDKGGGTFDELLAVVRERVEGSLHNLSALTNRRSPWVRLEAIRNLRVLATGTRRAASADPPPPRRPPFPLTHAPPHAPPHPPPHPH